MPCINGLYINDGIELKKHLKPILKKYTRTMTLCQADRLFFEELIKYHPKFNGIYNPHILIIYTPSKQHHTILVNNRKFNPYMCFNKPHEHRHKVINALREIVRPDILSIKLNAYKHAKKVNNTTHNKTTYSCMYTGQPMLYDNCSIHHLIPFHAITTQYFTLYKLRVEDIIVELTDNGYQLKDKNLATSFREFHRRYPVVLIHSEVHKIIHCDT